MKMENTIVAIFGSHDTVHGHVQFRPENKFKLINTVNDIYGITFHSIIYTHKWYHSEARVEAHNRLRELQPELFSEPKVWEIQEDGSWK